ncbi:MAG: hypothetical protein IOB84_10400 [Brevundimonas sp.]|jgi:hypothetical protein|nr:hypothetical protein [Brevundimonas sp.]
MQYVERIVKLLREEQQRVKDQLISQPSPTIELYNRQVGKVQGLALAEAMLLDALQEREEKEDALS